MTDTQVPAAPPSTPSGWFTDPADAARLRWWNGTNWTEHVQVPPPQPTAGEIASAHAAAAAAQQRSVEAAYVPFTHNWGAEQDAAVSANARRSAQTLPAWFLAFSPLWIGAARVALGLVSFALPPLAQDGIAIIGTFAILCGLAHVDGQRLEARGFRRTSALWALILPVYLILRVARVGPRALGPMLTYFAIILMAIAAAVAIPLVVYGTEHAANQTPASVTAPTTPVALTSAERAAELTPTGMQNRVMSDFSKTGVDLTQVRCQPLPDSNDGSQTRCDIWISSGKFGTVVEQVAASDPYAPFHQVGFTR
ncbi:MAG TPA: DUF2510 domain-containing protein [Galbitalea sp.]|jgi:hypothetical protein